jgi:uncharacterized SAM-binding protein YcdF (DUF218 family)
MDVAVTRLLEALLLPPGGPLLLTAAGLLLMGRRPRLGRALALLGVVVLWAASLPVVGHALMHSLETHPPLDAQELRAAQAQAIVVLGAGRYGDAPEYGGIDTVSRWGLERLRYGAHVHRITGLPILVTGGSPTGGRVAEAGFLGDYLEKELGIGPVWREERSRTTAENARYSAALLRERGIRRVLLVTHAWHEARAMESFRRVGLDPIAAPTGFAARLTPPRNWLPDVQDGLLQTQQALHEWLGRAVYALRR